MRSAWTLSGQLVRLKTRRDRLDLPSRHTRQNPRDRSIVVSLEAIALNLLAVAVSTSVLVLVFQPKWIVWPGPQFGTALLSDAEQKPCHPVSLLPGTGRPSEHSSW